MLKRTQRGVLEINSPQELNKEWMFYGRPVIVKVRVAIVRISSSNSLEG